MAAEALRHWGNCTLGCLWKCTRNSKACLFLRISGAFSQTPVSFAGVVLECIHEREVERLYTPVYGVQGVHPPPRSRTSASSPSTCPVYITLTLRFRSFNFAGREVSRRNADVCTASILPTHLDKGVGIMWVEGGGIYTSTFSSLIHLDRTHEWQSNSLEHSSAQSGSSLHNKLMRK